MADAICCSRKNVGDTTHKVAQMYAVTISSCEVIQYLSSFLASVSMYSLHITSHTKGLLNENSARFYSLSLAPHVWLITGTSTGDVCVYFMNTLSLNKKDKIVDQAI